MGKRQPGLDPNYVRIRQAQEARRREIALASGQSGQPMTRSKSDKMAASGAFLKKRSWRQKEKGR